MAAGTKGRSVNRREARDDSSGTGATEPIENPPPASTATETIDNPPASGEVERAEADVTETDVSGTTETIVNPPPDANT